MKDIFSLDIDERSIGLIQFENSFLPMRPTATLPQANAAGTRRIDHC
ncbi:hypothetical protein ACQR1I_22210 [Bradyrhizobium sp. HKCCYLS2038]